MAKGRLIFTKMDLIAPWGICILAACLCALGILKAPELPAKIISGIVGGFFLSCIPIWYICRRWLRTVSYTTRHGVNVVWGSSNKPEKLMIETLTEDLITFWSSKTFYIGGKACTIPELKAREAMLDMWAFFLDQEKLSLIGRWARGYATGKDIVCGWNGSLSYTQSLFRHEGAHVMLNFGGYAVLSEKEQHDLFKTIGLGA